MPPRNLSVELEIMLPPFLKYFDIARLVGVGVRCPVCHGGRCRQARWHSRTEKLGSEGLRPYRCNDCMHRFLERRSAVLERGLVNGTAGLVLGFGVLTVGELWLEGDDVAKPAPASAVQSGEGVAGAQAQGLTVAKPANAVEDPATLAKKIEEAAENGDAAAMLQLGRDLATGNQRPKDVAQAAKWVKLAAATGYPEGMLELARFYRDGLGVEQNSVRAYVWLSRAAAANISGAQEERDALVRTMSEAKLREAQRLSVRTEPAAVVRQN